VSAAVATALDTPLERVRVAIYEVSPTNGYRRRALRTAAARTERRPHPSRHRSHATSHQVSATGEARHDHCPALHRGEWIGSADGATFESVSPIDNTVIAQVARAASPTPTARWTRPRRFDTAVAAMNPASRKKILHTAGR